MLDYDRNENFCDLILLPEVNIVNWPDQGFKQLQKSHQENMPPLRLSHIDTYLRHRQASDGLGANDLQAMCKGKSLLEGDRVEACSIVSSKGHTYFTGIVRAQMKKKVKIQLLNRCSVSVK